MGLFTPAQQTEAAKVVVRPVYFWELQLSGGTQRISTHNAPLTWGGFAWSGLGQLLGMGSVQQSEGGVPAAITLTLTAADPSWLALAAGPVEEYRGRTAKLYACPLDAGFQLVGTPALVWTGVMDTSTISIPADGQGAVHLKCESRAYALKRRPVLRLNAEQHRRLYPTDNGLDYLTDLIGKPQAWLSKKFMAR